MCFLYFLQTEGRLIILDFPDHSGLSTPCVADLISLSLNRFLRNSFRMTMRLTGLSPCSVQCPGISSLWAESPVPVRKWLEPWPVVSSADNCDYYSITGGQRRSSSQEGVTMVSSPSLILITMGLGALARLDTLSPSDYLTLAIDCKDSRIQVSAVIKSLQC